MQAQAAEQPQQDKPKGRRFAKVYDQGWDRIGQLVTLKGGPTVAKLWLFLARNCDHHNALSCTHALLAEELGCSEKSIQRASKYLADNGALRTLKLGTARVYVLNPDEIWKTADENKLFCAFDARVLVSKTENGNIKERLTHVRQKQASLDLDQPAKNPPRQRGKPA